MNPSRDDDHAEAFRRGYEKGRLGGEPTVPLHDLMGAGDPPDDEGYADEEPTVVAPRPASAPAELVATSGPFEPFTPQVEESEPDRRRVTVAVLLGALALVLIAGAFGVGRLLAGSSEQHSAGATADGSAQPAGYSGPVQPVHITDSMASCQADSSVDAAGNKVTYEPAKAHDSKLTTAWRCDGSGVGQRYTLSLPAGTTVAEVGLVPGYAKTDPESGVDRYAENNRITKVRWIFDDGKSYVQEMSGDPHNRSMRTLRIPETRTSRVVLQILASQPGPRNTVAISEIRIATPAN